MTNTLTEQKLKVMMDLQESMNGKVNKDWRKEDYPWVDAIWTEAAEAYNHTYWEWWKNQGKEPNIPQIKLEIVDVWHFLISELLQHEESEDMNYFGIICHVSEVVEKSKTDKNKTPAHLKLYLKALIMSSLLPKSESRIVELLASFMMVMESMDMNWTELYKLYVGKNTLNRFRQDNGYKTATEKYKAVWGITEGLEDNDYLTTLLQTLDAESTTFIEDVYSQLRTLYEEFNVKYFEANPANG